LQKVSKLLVETIEDDALEEGRILHHPREKKKREKREKKKKRLGLPQRSMRKKGRKLNGS